MYHSFLGKSIYLSLSLYYALVDWKEVNSPNLNQKNTAIQLYFPFSGSNPSLNREKEPHERERDRGGNIAGRPRARQQRFPADILVFFIPLSVWCSLQYGKESFNIWDFKRAILNTLIQAVKAIGGGVLALKGQLIKGSGFLVSTKGRIISSAGEAISGLGKNLAASALVQPPPPKPYGHVGYAYEAPVISESCTPFSFFPFYHTVFFASHFPPLLLLLLLLLSFFSVPRPSLFRFCLRQSARRNFYITSREKWSIKSALGAPSPKETYCFTSY